MASLSPTEPPRDTNGFGSKSISVKLQVSVSLHVPSLESWIKDKDPLIEPIREL